MLLRISTLLLSLFTFSSAFAQVYQLNNALNGQTITTCKANFRDSGGGDYYTCGTSANNYGNNEDRSVTFCSGEPGRPLRISFIWWSIQNNADYLYIYDGPSTASPLIGTVTGGLTENWQQANFFTSSAECLTIRFVSDGSGVSCGWEAIVGCEPRPCGGNLPAADVCSAAPVICGLDGYCGNTGGWYTPVNVNIGSSSAGGNGTFCGSIENNSWLSFIAESTSATFEITSSNCISNARGVQAIVLNTANCNTFNAISNCVNQSGGPGTSTLTTTNTLVPGNRYYIMIDGFDANICDYTIKALTGVQVVRITAAPSTTVCEGAQTTLTVVDAPPGSTYSWEPAAQITGPTNGQSIIASPTLTTTYTATVEIPGLCGTQAVSQEVKVSPLPILDVTGDSIICEGEGPVTLTVAGTSPNPTPTSFSASPNVQIPDNNATGITSNINVSGLEGNVNNQLLSVCINITHNFVSDLQVLLRCPDGTTIELINRSGGAGRNYTNTCFTPDATQTLPNASAGAPFTGDWIPVQPFSNLNNCLLNGNWSLIVRDRLSGDVGRLVSWTITFSGELEYTWSPATGLNTTTGPVVPANPATTTTYTVTTVDRFGCTGTATKTVIVSDRSAPVFSPIGPFCAGQNFPTLPSSSTDGITGVWSPASISGAGQYTFTPDPGQCAEPLTIDITVRDTTVIAISGNALICDGNSATLTASGAQDYNWTPASGLSTTTGPVVIAGPSNTTTYVVTGVDANGCPAKGSVTVIVEESPVTSPIFNY
jgi:subtilisin-like proprotein convertase family protein